MKSTAELRANSTVATEKAVKTLKDFLRCGKLDEKERDEVAGEHLATRELEQAIHMMGRFFVDADIREKDPELDTIMRDKLKNYRLTPVGSVTCFSRY